MKIIYSILALLAFRNSAAAHGMSKADQMLADTGNNMQFFELGARHMITGYDHLLFLFGVIFFLFKFKDILKIVTAFTIGHSISLIFATLLSIKADYYLIDAVIALTVCYKGFENLGGFKTYFDIEMPNIHWMVVLFGLIHGFGLSSRLQQLPLGDEGLLMKIISFNIGVEVGQIAALSVIFTFLLILRKTKLFPKLSKIVNVAIIFAGFLFLLMQLHGYQHSHYPDDFPFNQHEHDHIHQSQNAPALQQSTGQRDISEFEIKDGTLHTHDDGETHFH